MAQDYPDGYSYGYEEPQYYYETVPNMYQPAYGVPAQQYGGWDPAQNWQGYGPPQQIMYDGYAAPQQEYYGHQGYNPGVQNYQQPASYTESNSQQMSRSKHSYSQNRSRNRQRTDQSQTTDIPQMFVENTPNETNITGESKDNGMDSATSTNMADYPTDTQTDRVMSDVRTEKSNNNSSTTYDRGKYRGSRFQGSDSRSRPFNRAQEQHERQRMYNKNYNAKETDIKQQSNPEFTEVERDIDAKPKDGIPNKPKEMSNTKISYSDSKAGKSYKDSRASKTDNRNNRDSKPNRDRFNNTDDSKEKFNDSKDRGNDYNSRRNAAQSDFRGDKNTNSIFSSRRRGDVSNDIEENVDAIDKGNDKGNGSSSGSGRKGAGLNTTGRGSPRDYKPQSTNDRYNYRGQDYNQRHKHHNPTAGERGGEKTTGIERGGDRTKLTETQDDNNLSGDEKDKDIADNDVNVKQQRPQRNAPKRGTRANKNKQVDESQRGMLIEQLTRGRYECMVCCETIRAQNALWSCTNCYHCFHLRCVKKWARTPNAVVSGSEKDGWRCPACQNTSFQFPNQYRCFCGKVRDPDINRMETPHSCGDNCQKDRGEDCKHPCNILCHPGPCPECVAIVNKSCDCGKTKQTVKCGQSTVVKCDQVCERLLNCGQHFCTAKCHNGPCDKCEHNIQQSCYGDHESREIVCGSEESFIESYSCTTVCSKSLDCGNHNCDQPCHHGNCDSCPYLPINIQYCPCGSTSLDQITSDPRATCLDPIPTCGRVCNKEMKCGPRDRRHRCERVCHEGDCGPCSGVTVLSCRCLSMDKEFQCSEIGQLLGLQTDECTDTFLCDRRCNRKKTCGRHKCGQSCCIREEHLCDQLCGRKLSCGLHKCDEPCHKNNCPPCLMAGFDELTCTCGAEVLYPPIPCGTRPPECHRPCTRQHGCDHPVRHNCHSDEYCPPCTELTKKKCMGNHVLRANIACHLTDISCGMKCGRPYPCGEHLCVRICHKEACLEDGESCSQPCTRKRELCDHPCGSECHGEEPCPATPCKAKVLVKCACGNREAPTVCSAGGSGLESSDYQRITMQSLKDSFHGIMGASSINITKLQAKGLQGKIIECDESCAVLERNRRFASALDITNADLTGKLGTPVYTDFLKEQAKQNSTFVAGIEKDLSDLVQSAKQSKKQPSRSHAFPNMNSNQRRVIHELAEFYGCETQAYDFEPKKNVVATAPRERCWMPGVSLTSLVQRELHGPRAPPPIPHVYKEETLRLKNEAVKQSTRVLSDGSSSSGPLAEGWQVIGKRTKKVPTKSAISTMEKFEDNVEELCASGTVDYATLSNESKEALKAEPVIDYFDFTMT